MTAMLNMMCVKV